MHQLAVRLQQRKNDVAAAENQRAHPIEAVDDGQSLVGAHLTYQWQSDEQDNKEDPCRRRR
jgi:hypothetical protein